jgi:quercetin dioxygenase-like cupin family protein
MQHLDDIAAREIRPGFFGKMVHGESGTVSFWEIRKGSVLIEHQHVQEQTTYLVEGELEMVIGGEPFLLTPGMVHVIPSLVPHSAMARTDVRVIDFFAPARDDYR